MSLDIRAMGPDEIQALLAAGIITQQDIQEQMGQTEQDVTTTVKPAYEDPYGLLRGAEQTLGGLETARTLATGIIADPLAKVTDIVSTPFLGIEEGTKAGERVRGALTKTPFTSKGKQYVGRTAEFLQPVGEFFQGIGTGIKTGVQSATGSEMAGEMTKDIASLIPDLLGLKIGAKLTRPIPLKNPDGTPTKELRALLARKGLEYEALSPEVKAALPAVYTGSESSLVSSTAASEFAAGGRQAGLAGVKPTDKGEMPFGKGGVEKDPLGLEAVRQGWSEGFVAAVKTSSPSTKSVMDQMIQQYRAFRANEAFDPNLPRPSDLAGDAVVTRIEYIKDTIDNANKVKDQIADQVFVGMPVDVNRVGTAFTDALKAQGVELLPDASGVLKVPRFEGSKISVDRTAQRVVKDTIKLLSEAGTDAASLHALKGQLDALINYRRSAANKLTPDGEKVVKALRREINTVLREASPEYARANDIVSKGLDAFERFDDATASGVKIFEETANKTIGTELRKVFSNYTNRVDIQNAVGNLEQVAKDFAKGGDSKAVVQFSGQVKGPRQTQTPDFDLNAYDLVRFASAMDDRIKPVAQKSFAGEMGSAVERGVRRAVDPTGATPFMGAAMDIVGGMMRRGEPVTDVSALNILEELVKRNGQ